MGGLSRKEFGEKLFSLVHELLGMAANNHTGYTHIHEWKCTYPDRHLPEMKRPPGHLSVDACLFVMDEIPPQLREIGMNEVELKLRLQFPPKGIFKSEDDEF